MLMVIILVLEFIATSSFHGDPFVSAWLSPGVQSHLSNSPVQHCLQIEVEVTQGHAIFLLPTTAASSLAHRNGVLIGFSKAGCLGISILSFS